jgi:ChrR Cupin-like domain
MDENHPANLRARISHYRQMQRLVDDRALSEALEELIRLTQEKLMALATSAPSPQSVVDAGNTNHSPATLGDVLYANCSASVLEQDWVSLVQAIANGDELALYALYERAHLFVLSFAEQISGSRKIAEEVTVDVFHDLWGRAYFYDPDAGTVLAWIMNQTRSRAMIHQQLGTREFIPRGTTVPHETAWLQSLLARRIAKESGKEPNLPPAQRWSEPEWEQVAPGIECKLLATDMERHRVSMQVRLAPGASYPAHTHAGTEELFLLDGELWIDERKLFPGDYNYGAPGTGDKRVWSETGCSCVLVTSIKDRLH